MRKWAHPVRATAFPDAADATDFVDSLYHAAELDPATLIHRSNSIEALCFRDDDDHSHCTRGNTEPHGSCGEEVESGSSDDDDVDDVPFIPSRRRRRRRIPCIVAQERYNSTHCSPKKRVTP